MLTFESFIDLFLRHLGAFMYIVILVGLLSIIARETFSIIKEKKDETTSISD